MQLWRLQIPLWTSYQHVPSLVQPHDDPLREPREDGEEGVDALAGHEGRLEDEPHREEDGAVLGPVEEVLQVLNLEYDIIERNLTSCLIPCLTSGSGFGSSLICMPPTLTKVSGKRRG